MTRNLEWFDNELVPFDEHGKTRWFFSGYRTVCHDCATLEARIREDRVTCGGVIIGATVLNCCRCGTAVVAYDPLEGEAEAEPIEMEELEEQCDDEGWYEIDITDEDNENADESGEPLPREVMDRHPKWSRVPFGLVLLKGRLAGLELVEDAYHLRGARGKHEGFRRAEQRRQARDDARRGW